MANRIHPHLSSVAKASSSCSSSMASTRHSFTVWMKSLVMQGNGCTVFNEEGQIVYRIDNYDKKCSNEVYLMDLQGKVLFTILQRNLWIFRSWMGYKCSIIDKKKNPLFRVRRNYRVNKKDSSFQVIVQSENGEPNFYRLEEMGFKSAFKIIDSQGGIVAEAKRKQSSSGVLLGDDVLTLVVEPNTDHSLIMALTTVYGLIHCRM